MQKAFLLILVLLVIGCSQTKKQTFDIVLKSGNVIDLETGAITKQDIFINEGRITKILSTDTDFQYQTESEINAENNYILPGFWDNHVHFRGGDSLIQENKNLLPLFIANGITTVRDAGGDLTSSVHSWQKEIEAGELVGPTIFTSGPKIDGPNATWAGSLVVENENDISTALDSLQALKTDFVKLYDSRISRDIYLKTIEEATKRGLVTSGHMPFTVTLDETVKAGISGIEHLYYIMKGCSSEETAVTEKLKSKEIGFWQAMPILQSTYQDSTAQNTFLKLKENDVYVIPTLHIGETLSYLDEVDHQNDDYLKYMGKGIVKTYQGRIKRALNASEKAAKDRKELDTFFGSLTKSLSDAEVKLLAGSDSGAFNSYTYPGISLHKELEAMVKTGMSPLKALQTSAYNGATFLKKDGDYGIIAEGKIADLVILTANPLDDIRNTKEIDHVVQGNKAYDKQQLDTLLSALLSN